MRVAPFHFELKVSVNLFPCELNFMDFAGFDIIHENVLLEKLGAGKFLELVFWEINSTLNFRKIVFSTVLVQNNANEENNKTNKQTKIKTDCLVYLVVCSVLLYFLFLS